METQHGMQNQTARSSDNNEVQQVWQQAQLNIAASPSPPPSASSSPSHEFSFTISLHPTAQKVPGKTKSSPNHPLAIDLSPADEIFFHGHLLPLHLLSHLPVSPRSSTNSLDSFTLPINKLSQHNNNNNNISIDSARTDDQYIKGVDQATCQEAALLESKGTRYKSKSFSLFGWRKGSEATKRDHHHHHHQDKRQNRKLSLDMSHVVKKYMRLVKPFLFLRNRRGNSQLHRQQPYSFSGNLEVKMNNWRKRKGEYSAPASMRTSPTNSGLLVASGTVTPTCTSDSTMEELQAAIQAAIAHCKKSIAEEDNKIKLP